MKKKLFTILAVFCLLASFAFAGDSTKYIETFVTGYNWTQSSDSNFNFSLKNVDIGFASAIYFTGESETGLGLTVKADVGLDLGDVQKISVATFMGPSYYLGLNNNIALSFSLGPAFGSVASDAYKNKEFYSLGIGADVNAYLMPTRNFGFVVGVTGYVLPLSFGNSSSYRPSMYSVSGYLGVAIALHSNAEDNYYLPYYY